MITARYGVRTYGLEESLTEKRRPCRWVNAQAECEQAVRMYVCALKAMEGAPVIDATRRAVPARLRVRIKTRPC